MVTLDSLLLGIIYLIVGYLLFWLGKAVYSLTHPDVNVNEELLQRNNAALGVALVGYYFGLILAIGGSIVGPSRGLVEDLLDLALYGVFGILALNISALVRDKLILYRFRVKDEIIRDQNVGTGVVEAAISIASGMVIYGAVAGEGGTLLTAIAFWMLGQAALVIVGLVYQFITPYDIHELIERDNVAVGVGFAGALVAVGNVVRGASEADFISWSSNLSFFALEFLITILLLPVIRFVTDKMLLPGSSLTKEIAKENPPNLGAAYVEAFSYIGASFLIVWAM